MASQITSLTIIYTTVYFTVQVKILKLRVTGLCVENSPVTGEFPAQRATNAENVSIWWRHHGLKCFILEDGGSFIQHGQYRGCWWPGDAKNQTISGIGIDVAVP